MRNLVWVTFVVLAACRPNPGAHYYESQEDFSLSQNQGGTLLGGAVPYEEGTPRLSVGAFYEGGASETVPINESDTFYYIYDQVLADETRQTTFTQTTDSDHVEGTYADHFLVGDLGWFGCGIHWNDARDLSVWNRLSISLKSSAPSISNIEIGMNNVVDENEIAYFWSATDYGFTNDGEWHRLVLPIRHLTAKGFNPASVRAPLILTSGVLTIESGAELLVDDVYFFTSEDDDEEAPVGLDAGN